MLIVILFQSKIKYSFQMRFLETLVSKLDKGCFPERQRKKSWQGNSESQQDMNSLLLEELVPLQRQW